MILLVEGIVELCRLHNERAHPHHRAPVSRALRRNVRLRQVGGPTTLNLRLGRSWPQSPTLVRSAAWLLDVDDLGV